MSYDSMDLGSVPADEPCEQVPYKNPGLAIAECRAYTKQLIRMYGEPPLGTRYRTMRNPHDFGVYHSVAIEYTDSMGRDYALKVENGLPLRWDELAMIELRQFLEEQEKQRVARG